MKLQNFTQMVQEITLRNIEKPHKSLDEDLIWFAIASASLLVETSKKPLQRSFLAWLKNFLMTN